MAIEDKKVRDLPPLVISANDDLLIISDTSEPTDENKTKVTTKANFLSEVYTVIAGVATLLTNYFTKSESDARYLQSYTETDPVFVASPSHGITAPDIANWNSKSPSNHNHTLNSLSEKSYNSLTDKPTIPTNLSDFNKDITFDERYYTEVEVSNLLNSYIPTTQKGAVSGVATLDDFGKVPTSQLPQIAITNTFVVASEPEMLFLTAQTGDVAIRSDENKTYILQGADPTLLGDWAVLATPTDTVTSVFGRNGVVTAQNGDYTTSQITESGNLYFTTARVLATALAGFTVAGTRTAIVAGDTILQSFGKVQKYFNDLSALAFSGSASDLTGTKTSAFISDFAGAVDSVAIAGLSGLSVDTNTLFVNSVNHRVGIGTTNPTYKLQVQTPDTSTAGVVVNTGVYQSALTSHKLILGANSGTLVGGSISASAGNIYIAPGSGDTIFNNAGGVEIARLVSSTGNLGIGTTNPSYRLHLYGNVGGRYTIGGFQNINSTGSAEFSFINDGGQVGSIGSYGTATAAGIGFPNQLILRSDTSSGLVIMSSNANGYTRFFTGGTSNSNERIRITSTGNVGIGTTNPLTKLHVYGDFAMTTINGTGTPAITGTQKLVLGGNTSNGVGNQIGWYPNSSFTGDIAQISADATAYGVSSAGALIFRTNSGSETSPSEKMRISSNGNVGIGTAAPGSILDISTSTPILTLRSSSTTVPHGIEFKNVGSLDAFIKQTPSTGELQLNVGRNSSWGGFQTFFTDTVERMRITSTGNVGIGTTTPGSKLSVNGNSYFAGNIYATGTLSISTSTLYTLTNGNVGIGTTSPTAVLHLKAGGTTAGTAPLKLTTQASGLTSVEQGAFELIGNSLQFTQLLKRRGINMTSSVILADTTVGNTTVESGALITAEHGANYLEVGKMEEIKIIGTIQQTVTGGGVLSIRTKYAGTTILTTTTVSGTIAEGTPFEITVYTTCRSIGATGTMQINSVFKIDGVTNVQDAKALVTIDTTVAQNTTVTAQWSVANASNTMTVNQGYVHCIETNK